MGIMSTTYNPAPKFNYLPFVISNNTTLNADEIYICFVGNYKTAGADIFFFALSENTSPPMGVFSPVEVSNTTFSATYSYPLSSLPQSTTNANDYLCYIPSAPSNRFYFSINGPVYLQSDVPNSIASPTYFAFYDPNYNQLFESIEVGYILHGGSGGEHITWTASINTTEVDAFGLPLRIQYQTFTPTDPSAVTQLVQVTNALPSGFGVGGGGGNTTRNEILTAVINTLTDGDETGQSPKEWPKLAIPFYTNPYAPSGLTTYLRVLSPKQSVGDAESPSHTGGLTSFHLPAVQPGPVQFFNYNYPPFPLDYVNNTIYGDTNSFADSLFSNYTGGLALYISTGGGSPTIYECVTSGTSPNQVLTCTGISGPNTGQVSTLDQSALNTFSMYSGNQLFSGGPDGDLLGFYFGDAFTVGFLGGTLGTVNGVTPPNIPIDITDAVTWEPYFITDYYTPQYSFTGGPWLDLYAHAFHEVAVENSSAGFLTDQGLCYAYDFDDSLGFSGTITPTTLTPFQNYPYASITLGVIDTGVPDPYSDPNTYSVTFNFPGGSAYALQYAQGSGSYIDVTSGTTITDLYSNRSNPLKIHYTNGQGPTGDHYFDVYLYYQFLIPTVVYNSSEDAIINATTITPGENPPTSFTIALLP